MRQESSEKAGGEKGKRGRSGRSNLSSYKSRSTYKVKRGQSLQFSVKVVDDEDSSEDDDSQGDSS